MQNGKAKLERLLTEQGATVGAWITFGHPAMAEIMAKAGFDWVTVDLEHTVISLREAEELIRTIDLHGVTALVRLSWNDHVQIKRVMDAGAHGVIVPSVNTPDEAKRAVAAVKYPPVGTRGVGLGRAQAYGMKFDEYTKWVAEESLVIIQVEHVKAVENLEAILSVPGVDGLFVGPYDLSASLGVPGQFDHPEVRKALDEIRRVARAHPGMIYGIHIIKPRPDEVITAIKAGYNFVAYSTDMYMVVDGCQGGMEAINRHRKRPS